MRTRKELLKRKLEERRNKGITTSPPLRFIRGFPLTINTIYQFHKNVNTFYKKN